MTRKNKLLINTLASLIYQIVTIFCGFILPRLILVNYGSTVNGLISSITMFLSFISLAECGVGAVVQSALYGPLASGDNSQVNKIIIASVKFYKKIAYILIAYSAALIILYPLTIRESFDFAYTALLIIIISLSSFAQYYFSISYRLLLNADQMGFVQLGISSVTIIANLIISIALMRVGASIHVVKLVASSTFVIQILVLRWYVKKNYILNLKLSLQEEPIKQKWNGLAQHIASVVLGSTDTVVLTLFSTLKSVSIYGIYHLVVNGIQQLLTALTSGLLAMFGNMIAKKEFITLNNTFNLIEWLLHIVVTLLFTMTGILIVPFVRIYTAGITDANYILPTFAILITLAQGIYCIRLPYNMIVLAAGHYKETQSSSIIEAMLNVIISVVVVVRYDLVGVAVGTLVAMLYRTCYLAWYLSRNIIHRRLINFIKNIFVDCISVMLMIITKQYILYSVDTFAEWLILAAKVGIFCLIEIVIINIIFYRKTVANAIELIMRSPKRKISI